MKQFFLAVLCIVTGSLWGAAQEPQPSVAPKPSNRPRIVTAAQANGVYSSYDNEIRILALGKNKLKVQFDGTYHTISKSVNTGYASGEANIEGNIAVLELTEWGPCKITMVFLRNNRLKVTQEGDSPDCGFGHNVRADGTYRKIRGGKPKFEPPPE